MASLKGNEVESNKAFTSQVYDATHKGENFLPFMKRSFISFTYGGKRIEDFNLIATISGNRLARNGYANFDNLVTSYEVGQGQYYWGSHYRNNSITFNLATDGMDQRQLDDFVWWFAADQARELILAEHPNRAIIARVDVPPQISLLPFEKKIEVPIGEKIYKTSTTLYKGEIELQLIMDEPHWYSVKNIFGQYDSETGSYRDTWIDANGDEHSVFDDPDAIKVSYEDGIPISSMIHSSMLLGDNTYATVTTESYSCIATVIEDPQDGEIRTETYVEGAVTGDDDNPLQTSYTYEEDFTREEYDFYEYQPDGTQKIIKITEIYPATTSNPENPSETIPLEVTIGRIAGPKMTRGESNIKVYPHGSVDGELYFYYTGTAPAPVKLSFKLEPQFYGNYISVPSNSFVPNANNKEYNTITIESVNKQELKFTTPGIYTAYNAAVKIFSEDAKNQALTFPEVAERIRDFVYHSAVRAWAMKILDYIIWYDSQNSGKNAFLPETNYDIIAARLMPYLFQDDQGKTFPAAYTFNSKTGEAIGKFTYRVPSTVGLPQDANTNTWLNYSATNIVESEENIGDMLKSNYLIIRDRNYSKDGIIEQWSSDKKEASHRFYHDIQGIISDVKIEYKNMYL